MSLAAAIEDAFDVEATLEVGKPGQFDVVVDGRVVFSKDDKGRFPERQEVLDAIGKLAR